ncbi:hypothetical protein LY474_22365 [Myxococcus stipitatus]|uniref:hypothetical protein n=1 Tax=Myxococcus stipitatus TaxID=83455 RepID=UPI001F1E50DE|nr:hypothetical protein [Myxococcus stipitatus]MCE9670553.1 hypothetical protein [Myxococcus stipitatus]
MEQEEELTSQEAPIPDCSNSPDTLVVYYQDASFSLVIGERGCSCGSWVSWGRTSTYRENAFYC